MVGVGYLITKFVATEKFIALFPIQMDGEAFQTMNLETMEKSTEQSLIRKAGEDWPITRYVQTEKYTEPFLILLAGAVLLILNFVELF